MSQTQQPSEREAADRGKRREQFVICAACGREFPVEGHVLREAPQGEKAPGQRVLAGRMQGATAQCPNCAAQVVIGSAVKVSSRRKRRSRQYTWFTVVAGALFLLFFLTWFWGPIAEWDPWELGGRR